MDDSSDPITTFFKVFEPTKIALKVMTVWNETDIHFCNTAFLRQMFAETKITVALQKQNFRKFL